MHHIDHLAQAASELDRVLKPGGSVLLLGEDFDQPDHSMHQPRHRPAAIDPHKVVALPVDSGLGTATVRSDTIGRKPALVVMAQR